MKNCYFREHHHKTLLIFHWRNQANLGTPKFAKEQGSSTRMVALWLGLCLWLSGCVFRGEWLHRMAWSLGLSDVKGGGFLEFFQRGIRQYFFARETDDVFFLVEVAQIDKKTTIC